MLQILFGTPIEMFFGGFRVFLLYNTGVVMGALTCGFTDVYRSVVGASGGVYTLLGVHCANLVLNWSMLGNSLHLGLCSSS